MQLDNQPISSNIVSLFIDAATKHPDKTALISVDGSVTYHELMQLIADCATRYHKKGIAHGQKVLVFVPMSIELYVTVLALLSLGAHVVFMDEWASRKRVESALTVVPVDVIIAPWKLLILTVFSKKARAIPLKLQPFKLKKNVNPIQSKIQPYDVTSDDTAIITFTTGSTGLPKAADRSHAFLNAQFDVLKAELDVQAGDVCLVTLPIVLMSILATGATGVIPGYNQRKPDAIIIDDQWDLIENTSVNVIIGSPDYVIRLASGIGNRSCSDQIRRILTGGSPVFPDMAKDICTTFAQAECIIAYGSTEAEPISTLSMRELVENENMDNGLCVGPLNEKIKLKIIRPTIGPINLATTPWTSLEVSDGSLGEILVSGPHVLSRYLNSESAFRENKIVDGDTIWHRTGDSGRYIDGQLYLSGRVNQLIELDDGCLSLFTEEYRLRMIEGVEYGTVLQSGQQLITVIQINQNTSISAIKDQINNPIYQSEIKVIKKMPLDARHNGKIDYVAVGKLVN